jgi:hypothetical protein
MVCEYVDDGCVCWWRYEVDGGGDACVDGGGVVGVAGVGGVGGVVVGGGVGVGVGGVVVAVDVVAVVVDGGVCGGGVVTDNDVDAFAGVRVSVAMTGCAGGTGATHQVLQQRGRFAGVAQAMTWRQQIATTARCKPCKCTSVRTGMFKHCM